MSAAQDAQRRANVAVIAEGRRAKERCIRGHKDWVRKIDGRRMCRTCNRDRAYYAAHGLDYRLMAG